MSSAWPRTPVRGAPHRQRGIALAVVVWFLAGMSLLVAGIVLSARTDTRLAQVHYARAQVATAGDGAINFLLADLQDRRLTVEGGVLPQGRYQVGEDMVAVHAVPVDALVDIATTTVPELAATARAARVPSGDGEGLARAVVQYRDSPRRRVRIDSIEDLLGANGVNRAALDALRDYITVTPIPTGNRRGRGLRPGARQADRETAEKINALQSWTPVARARHPELVAQGRLPGDRASSAGGSFRIDALVRRGQDVWLRRRWVTAGGGQDGLPWRFQRTEPVRMVPRS